MELPATAAILDGEVVVLDERGRSTFGLLQQLGSSRRGLVPNDDTGVGPGAVPITRSDGS